MSRPWLFLVLSGLLQVGWVVSLRQTQGFTRLVPILFFGLFGLTSTVCLSLALEGIPMGTAYAVWTGISVAGSVLVDLVVFREVGLLRLACIVLILLGTTGLKLAGEAGPSERAGALEKANVRVDDEQLARSSPAGDPQGVRRPLDAGTR